jgi:hypothetical protein
VVHGYESRKTACRYVVLETGSSVDRCAESRATSAHCTIRRSKGRWGDVGGIRSGLQVRRSRTRGAPGLHGRCRTHARAGDRGEYGRLQRGKRSGLQAPTVRERRRNRAPVARSALRVQQALRGRVENVSAFTETAMWGRRGWSIERALPGWTSGVQAFRTTTSPCWACNRCWGAPSPRARAEWAPPT